MKAITILLGLFVAMDSAAATRTWVATFPSDGLWSDPNNWSPVGVPQPGEILEFDEFFPAAYAMVNDLAGLQVSSLRFRNGDYTLRHFTDHLTDYRRWGVTKLAGTYGHHRLCV